MAVRVYVPFTRDGLARALSAGRIDAPFLAHAVTESLVAAWPEGDDEELEYAAMAAAAHASWELRAAEDVPRRYVLAGDVAAVTPVDSDDPTLVSVDAELPWSRVASVHADLADIGEDDLDDADLAWHATQEIAGLVS
ncbi:DUF6912 family protein [Nocardioides jejuensis]|uniref:Uncharacterized protein n=1 Tax=Nocardioides jejuensis TaxID=2502782 RepID=A0A4R1BV64_9ACTN|nr:hypothetical protein [Nocardioides jejuensis]TCJ21185.1 hypothetical protein EPD65_15635 [Nocardioides jejuensis]